MRELFRPVALGIYLLSFMTGVVGALLLPTMSIFFADELGVSPLWVGLPYTGMALASIIYNQVIGHWSDRLADRRALIIGLCLVGVAACAIFALWRYYWAAFFCAIFLLSLAMVSFSQMLAYSLEYAETRLPLEKIALFNALVRAQIAFAWVAGPPIGFLLASIYGFTTLFTCAGILFAVVALLSIQLLPALSVARSTVASEQPNVSILQHKSLIVCLVAFSLMWGVNNAYLISLPLHLSRNLGIGTEWTGWIMGTAAGIEVPIMLLAGYLAIRISPMSLVRLSGFAGFILYAGVYASTTLWQLFVLQLANAIFIGVLAGLGVSVIQAMLPGRAGSASALYTNTTYIGLLLSSLLISTVAEVFGYREVFLVNMVLVLLAVALFFLIKIPAAHKR